MPNRKKQADDSNNFYKRFMASDVKNKKKLNEEVLYQLYKKIKPEPKDIAPTITNPPDHEPNQIHQCDLLVMPNDKGFRYGLTVVDTGSRLTDVEPMKEKKASDALDAIKRIYKRGILKTPVLSIQVDNGSEFKGVFAKFFRDKDVYVRVAQTGRSRQQGLVENRNGLIGRTLMRRMVAEELLTKEKAVEWVDYTDNLIRLMNESYYLKPIKLSGAKEMADPLIDTKSKELLEVGQKVRYQLDKPADILDSKRLYGGFREGDARWSITPVTIERIQVIPNQPVFYKLEGLTALYTKPQLQPVSDAMRLPPASVQVKFLIDKIVARKTEKKKVFYKVRWQGYDESNDTWEARDKLVTEVPTIVDQYESQSKKRKPKFEVATVIPAKIQEEKQRQKPKQKVQFLEEKEKEKTKISQPITPPARRSSRLATKK
jgi:hypothetical protein